MKELDFNEQLLHLGQCHINAEFKNLGQVLSLEWRVWTNGKMLFLRSVFQICWFVTEFHLKLWTKHSSKDAKHHADCTHPFIAVNKQKNMLMQR